MYIQRMAADLGKTMSIRLDSDEVLAITEHIDRLRERAGGVPFNFSDAVKHLISVGLEQEKKNNVRKRA